VLFDKTTNFIDFNIRTRNLPLIQENERQGKPNNRADDSVNCTEFQGQHKINITILLHPYRMKADLNLFGRTNY